MKTEMQKAETHREKTIADFGDQWSKYTDNEGWYGSMELFNDIISPLLDIEKLKGTYVAEVGSGTGRIVGMLLNAGAEHIYAIEPSSDAFKVLEINVQNMNKPNQITLMNIRGENWTAHHKLDYVFSVGVIHHIPEPNPVIKAAYDALKPGGYLFIWLYGYEGNELYLRIAEPIRRITTRLPHVCLRALVEIAYYMLIVYRCISRVIPIPLRSYVENVLWPMTPNKRRLVIYDQLNPAYAKYYRRDEAIQLLENAGFEDIEAHNRHGYSWSVLGQKPGGSYVR